MSSIPSTMKAVILSEVGGTDKLQYTESAPIPELKPGEALIKNSVSGLNFVDIYFRTGLYPSLSGYPLILGQEAAGTIVAIKEPNKYGFKVGERVLWMGQGGYAEYSAALCERLVKIAPEISDKDAVGAQVTGLTALSLVEEAYQVQKGETVLVHAAAGGVGLLLCQILKSKGVITIATAGGPDKCALAKRHGATHVIDYKTTSGAGWVEQVKELTGSVGVDAVYDSVGRDTWAGSIEVTKRKGKVVYFGSSSGTVPPLDLSLTRKKNISVIQSTLAQWLVTRAELEHYASKVQELLKHGELNVQKYKDYSLKEVPQAHIDLESRATSGKSYIVF